MQKKEEGEKLVEELKKEKDDHFVWTSDGTSCLLPGCLRMNPMLPPGGGSVVTGWSFLNLVAFVCRSTSAHVGPCSAASRCFAINRVVSVQDCCSKTVV